MASKDHYDVVVVGSGPAGSTTARVAAECGLKVLLVDKKQELGVPIQCSGAVSAHALHENSITPDSEFISEPIHGFKIYDASGNHTTLDYRILKPDKYRSNPLGYIIDRRRFDRYLMTMAERAGAIVWLKTEAFSYQIQNNGMVALHLRRFGQHQTIRTRMVVGADGLQSQVAKWANLKTHVKLSELASCLQYLVDHVETNGLLEIVTGHRWAPGGYVWDFPGGNNRAKVGLGVIRSMTSKDAHWHLNNFIRNSFLSERLKDSRIMEIQGGGVPLTAPMHKPYADHLILVGDAARQVNPLTGSGIHTALRSGVIAGEFLHDFLSAGESPTEENLAEYKRCWMRELGDTMVKIYKKKCAIFLEKDVQKRDQILYESLANYFNPTSEYRKV